MKNPEAALAAIVHGAAAKVGRFEVHEPTLGVLALLEAVSSPLTGGGKPTLEAWAETLFVLTREAAESRALLAQGRAVFTEAAMSWADGVTNAEAAELMRAAGDAVARMNAANPSPPEEDGQAGADPTAAGPTAG